jgi:hypothetical protein
LSLRSIQVRARGTSAHAVRRQLGLPAVEHREEPQYAVDQVPAALLPRLRVDRLRRVKERGIPLELHDPEGTIDLLHQRLHQAADDHLAVDCGLLVRQHETRVSVMSARKRMTGVVFVSMCRAAPLRVCVAGVE